MPIAVSTWNSKVALITVDTSAAYFEGDDENSNTQQMAHAVMLRSLTEMPGGPCVLIPCHLVKNATDDNLIPRGGGAFLFEVDGNLTAKRDDLTVEVHWCGKFRGRTSPQCRSSYAPSHTRI